MLVHAKAPRIDVRLSGKGTQKIIALVRKAYPDVKVVREAQEDDEELVDIFETDWYKTMRANRKPGDSIWVYRDNAGLTLAQLSKKTGIAESHLSAMENGKRGIGRISAMKLGKALNCDYRRFL
jgi:DNA-binding XRE family transcriptional regulator